MSTPRVLIVRAPGTNCDQETAFAFQQAGGETEVVHVNRLVDQADLVSTFQILCIPGGFSFGDDVAAGRIFASQIEHHLLDVVRDFHEKGKLILGICNGFQVLIKAGLLLPAATNGSPAATLTWNDSQKFEDRWVDLQCDPSRCVFLQGIEKMYLPIAHAEGKFVTTDPSLLSAWQANGQLALRYAMADGSNPSLSQEPAVPYPLNPNGSVADIAGVCDATGRVFGLMPHPERFIDPVQHPRWTREPKREQGDGLAIFENAVNYFAA